MFDFLRVTVVTLLFVGCVGVPRSYLDADEKQYTAIAAVVSKYTPVISAEDVRLLHDNLISWRARMDQASR